VLGRNEIKQRLLELHREKKVLMKLLDKGGLVVVEENNRQITTYNR